MYLMRNYKANDDILVLADNSHVDIIGRGSLGIFDNVANVARLSTSLISTKILCYKPFYFIVLHIDEIAYVIDRYVDPTTGGAVISTASIRSDGLYHMDNLLELIYYDYQGVRKINDYTQVD